MAERGILAGVAAFTAAFGAMVALSATLAFDPRPGCPSGAETAIGMSRADLRSACMSWTPGGPSKGLSCGQMRTLAFGAGDPAWVEAGVASSAFAHHCPISSDAKVPVAHAYSEFHDGRWSVIADFGDGCVRKPLEMEVSAGRVRYSGDGTEIEGAVTENGWVLASSTVTAVMGPLDDAFIQDRVCGSGRVAIVGGRG